MNNESVLNCDNELVLSSLGYTAEQIQKLKEYKSTDMKDLVIAGRVGVVKMNKTFNPK